MRRLRRIFFIIALIFIIGYINYSKLAVPEIAKIRDDFVESGKYDEIKNNIKDTTTAIVNSEPVQKTVEKTSDYLGVKAKKLGSTLKEEIKKDIENKLIELENKDLILEPVFVKRVKDGDTLVVNNEENGEFTVRLIGIDTPESVHPDETKNNDYGKIASEYTKALLYEGRQIYLEYDLSNIDPYGRTLAYVWLDTDTNDIENMLNAILLNNGYARYALFEPNKKYAEIFKMIEDFSKENKIGFWNITEVQKLWK